MQTAVWIFISTEGPVKIGEISEHSANRQEVRRLGLMSPNGQELDGLSAKGLKSSNFILFPLLFHLHKLTLAL